MCPVERVLYDKGLLTHQTCARLMCQQALRDLRLLRRPTWNVRPAGACGYRPGLAAVRDASRGRQGNAFIPSSAATAKPETLVSWSGEPG